MSMKVLDVEQGSDEWLSLRLSKRTASEAAAMMGDSPYMSRNKLLALKKGWQSNPVSAFKERLYEKGHEFEESARTITEAEEFDDFYPVVGSIELDGLELLASFDGLREDYAVVWEHKSWNEILAENVRNGLLEPLYVWQLEQQLLVSGAREAIFTVSDGTEEKRVSMVYKSDPNKRLDLIAGWQQFDKDLADFQLSAVAEVIDKKAIAVIPPIKWRVESGLVVSNIKECLLIIRELAALENNTVLESDDDFARKDAFNKNVKEARAKLKDAIAGVQAEFTSLDEFLVVAGEVDKVLQQMQSHGEKQVLEEKNRRKTAMVDAAKSDWSAYVRGATEDTTIDVCEVLDAPDFDLAIRNKRTMSSIKDSLDSAVANAKARATPIVSQISENMSYYHDHIGEYGFLFVDKISMLTQPPEAFQAVMTSRIDTHVAAEKKRAEQRREAQLREEEEAARRRVEQEERDRQRRESQAALQKENEARIEEQRRREQEDFAARLDREASKKCDPAPVETPVEEVVERDVWDDISDWERKHNIGDEASKELEAILVRWLP